MALLFYPCSSSVWFICFIGPNEPDKPKEPTVGSEDLTDRGIRPISSLWQRYIWYSIDSILTTPHGIVYIARLLLHERRVNSFHAQFKATRKREALR